MENQIWILVSTHTMFRKLVLTLVTVFLIDSSYADDFRKDFNKAVDYCNCKITYTYLNQYFQENPKSDKIKTFDIIKELLSKCTKEAPLEFDTLKALLTNGNPSLKNTEEDICEEINNVKRKYKSQITRDNSIEEILNSIFENAKLKIQWEKYQDVTSLQSTLKADLSDILIRFPADDEDFNKGTSINNVAINNLENRVSDLENSSNFWSFSIWMILIPLILGFLIFAIMKNELYELKSKMYSSRNESHDIPSGQSATQSSNMSSMFRDTSDFKRSVERNVNDVNDAVTKLQKDYNDLFQRISRIEMGSSTYQVFQGIKSTQRDVFYMSTPNRDGSFNLSASSQTFKPTASIYKFMILDSSYQKAEFEFVNDEGAIKDATNSPETYIYPVCKSNNSFNQNARRIKTVKPGIAIKRGDKWELETKAEIEYE